MKQFSASPRDSGTAPIAAKQHANHMKETPLERVVRNPWQYTRLDLHERGSKEIALAACSQVGYVLHAALGMRDDRDVVLAAVTQNGQALRFAGQSEASRAALIDDDAIVRAAVTHDSAALLLASPRLQEDPAMIQASGIGEDRVGEYLAANADRRQVLHEAANEMRRHAWQAQIEGEKQAGTVSR